MKKSKVSKNRQITEKIFLSINGRVIKTIIIYGKINREGKTKENGTELPPSVLIRFGKLQLNAKSIKINPFDDIYY